MLAKCPPLSSAEASGLQGPEKIPLSLEGSVTPALPVALQHTAVKAKGPTHSFRKPQLQESDSIKPIHSQLALWHGRQWKSVSHVQLFETPCYYSPWNSPGQNTGVGSLSISPGDLPNPGIEPRSPSFRADSLQAEPQGKPKNTGVGSLSLLQWIFQTQELTEVSCTAGILYQLSSQGSLWHGKVA